MFITGRKTRIMCVNMLILNDLNDLYIVVSEYFMLSFILLSFS